MLIQIPQNTQCPPSLLGFTWEFPLGEHVVVLGGQAVGKSSLAKWILNNMSVHTEIVSLEMEKELLEEERKKDDSEFVEGGFDAGTLAQELILEDRPSDELYQHWLTSLNLESKCETGIRFLSNGEIRKCLLLRALHRRPKILILDAPFEGLDRAVRENLLLLLQDLPQGMSCILMIQKLDDWPAFIPQGILLQKDAAPQFGTKTSLLKLLPSSKSSIREWPAPLLQSLESHKQEIEMDPLIHMEDIQIQYGHRTLFENLTWTIRKGQHWLLTGPNGSGKTTLLNIIYADHPQSYGQKLHLFGHQRGSGESIWDLRRHMGFVGSDLQRHFLNGQSGLAVVISGFHDSIGLYSNPTGLETLLARSWLEYLGLETLAHQYSDEMSYAEMRMLLIVRALVKWPKLLVLDEPCQGLDEEHRSQVLMLVQKITESTPTQLLYVTHHSSETIPALTHHLELSMNPKGLARPLFHQL